MAHFDVFNGDADGLCALHQLRLVNPIDATLVTGVKRDIALLERVSAGTGDSVTVLDVSIDVNRPALLALLKRGVSIQYFDHHGSGEVPAHPGLQAFIDTAPNTCTGILVDRWLGGAQRIWACVAAFGDNFAQTARMLAAPLALPTERLNALQELGECLNYNAYGETEADLIIHPAALYVILRRHADPFTFIEDASVYQQIREARRNDLDLARQVSPEIDHRRGKVVLLPDTAWSRRIRGAFGNVLATETPAQAHAILTTNAHGGYTVSVRAPLAMMCGADQLCQRFVSGGGRPAAAGINHLPKEKLPEFLDAFAQAFPMD